MNATSLFIGVLTGAIGSGYFLYGKKRGRYAPMLAGVVLCVVPYLVGNNWALAIISLALMGLPFVFKF